MFTGLESSPFTYSFVSMIPKPFAFQAAPESDMPLPR
jgi:hypothetical protein